MPPFDRRANLDLHPSSAVEVGRSASASNVLGLESGDQSSLHGEPFLVLCGSVDDRQARVLLRAVLDPHDISLNQLVER